jgi:hypothetical protein
LNAILRVEAHHTADVPEIELPPKRASNQVESTPWVSSLVVLCADLDLIVASDVVSHLGTFTASR